MRLPDKNFYDQSSELYTLVISTEHPVFRDLVLL